MGSQGLFRAVFGRKGVGAASVPPPVEPGALHPALEAELRRYDYFGPAFGRRALHFVATGEGRDLLGAMVPLARQNKVHNTTYQQAKPPLGELTGATDLAVATGEIAPGPQVARLMEIRAAADQISIPWGQKPDAREVAVMGMKAMLGGGVYRLGVNYKIDWTRAIPLETAFAHLKSVGGTMADLFAMLLPRSDCEFVASSPGSWSASDTCAQWLRAYPAALAEAVGKAQPNPRANLFPLIEHHKVIDVPEIEALIVAMLTKPFAKNDRAFAISALARLDPAHLLGVLERHLPTGGIDTRHGLVEAAGRAVTPDILALLADRAKVEKAAKVQAAIAALVEVAQEPPAEPSGQGGAKGYAAVDGTFVALPPLHDLPEASRFHPSDQDCITYMRIVEAITAHRSDPTVESCDRNRFYQKVDKDIIEASFALLTEGTLLPPGMSYALALEFRRREDGRAWWGEYIDRLPIGSRLRILLATRHDEVSYLINGPTYSYNVREETTFGVDRIMHWAAAERIGLRELALANHAAKTGTTIAAAASDPERNPAAALRTQVTQFRSSYDRSDVFASLRALPEDMVWPWLAESFDLFDEGLGLKPAAKPIPLDRIMSVLALLPATPQRYLPRLTEIAVAEKRPLRLQAMALLREAKDLPKRIEALLDDKRQPVRINAAGWLADIRATGSEMALRARLKKEKSDPVRAALIIALERLGVDLTDVIGPASLIAEAENANAKTPPKMPEWLVANRLPMVRFKDGTTAPQAVVEYWLALAIRLKDPGAHGQFGIYLDQLEPGDARALSNWVLESWIAYDTATATAEQAAAYAAANYHMSYRFIGSSRTPADKAAAIAEMTRDKLNELLNSGSDTKGMLALACRADPVWAAGRVRWFLKKHGRRSNQAMALLEAIAGTGAPAALQVVIAASTRLKQKSTQARAAEIAQRYAEDRGWSVDELADRTVPSAGFDDDGELELPCGEDAKPYVARLDALLAIHLFNPDGKPVKALPAGDDENSKDSKKAFTAAKKELGQIVTLQGERLFEAMCVERKWPVADWRLAFHQHPVMRRLIERLVWQGLDAEGQPLGLFRPTQEGDFTDAGDNDVAIDDFAAVRLAHGALVDADTCKAWIAHLKDYEIQPFIAQFDTLRSPLTPEQAEAEAITDRQGWAAPSLTIRGAAEKRGYQRVMRDSGGCHEYVKTFPSHGITATIWHTGSAAEDQNQRLALKELKFTKHSHRGIYRLKDVPPVMLAECWADYHAVAAKAVFDPEWEKISPW